MKKELSVKEVAEELGVSYVTALRYVKNNIPEVIRRGGRWYVPLEALERFKREGNQPVKKTKEDYNENW